MEKSLGGDTSSFYFCRHFVRSINRKYESLRVTHEALAKSASDTRPNTSSRNYTTSPIRTKDNLTTPVNINADNSPIPLRRSPRRSLCTTQSNKYTSNKRTSHSCMLKNEWEEVKKLCV